MKSSVKIKSKSQKCKYLHVIMNYQRIGRCSFFAAAISHLSLAHCYSQFSKNGINNCFQMLLTLKQNHQLWVLAQWSSTCQEIQWLHTSGDAKKNAVSKEKIRRGGRLYLISWQQSSNPALEPVSWWPEQPESSQAKLIHSKPPSKRSALSSNSAANILQTKTSKTALC